MSAATAAAIASGSISLPVSEVAEPTRAVRTMDEIRIYDHLRLDRFRRFSGAIVSGVYRRFFVIDTLEHADPDGNPIELHEGSDGGPS